MRKLTQEDFEQRMNDIHPGAFNLVDAKYISTNTPVHVTCVKCGQTSSPTPNNLFAGKGCRHCAAAKAGKNLKLSKAELHKRLTRLRPLTFPNAELEYRNNTSIITVICPKHGKLQQRASIIFRGNGCPRCNNESHPARQPRSLENFIAASQAKHGKHAFDYQRVAYSGAHSKVTLRCIEHDKIFEVMPAVHLRNKGRGGCPVCASKYKNADRILSQEQLLARFKEIHGETYADYNFDGYVNQKSKIQILCKDHGWFSQSIDSHLRGCGCNDCGREYTYMATGYGSLGQNELNAFVASLVPTIENWKIPRAKGKPRHIDVFVPSKNTGFEYNGLWFHSTAVGKTATYHASKQREASEFGVRLIHIFEDEWRTRRAACELAVAHILGCAKRSGARTLALIEVGESEAFDFYDNYHLQGAPRQGGVHLALKNNEKIEAVMSFVHRLSRRGTKKDEGVVELIRFAATHAIAGGASRLFSAYLKMRPEVKKIVSYSDNRWFNGGMYERLGFRLTHTTSPNYKYIRANTLRRFTKSLFQKKKLASLLGDKFDPNKTEWENCEANDYYRIYDCGVKCWVWERDSA